MIDLILAIFAAGGYLGGCSIDLVTPIVFDRGDLINNNSTGVTEDLKTVTPECPKDPEQEKIKRKIGILLKLRDFPHRRDRGPVMGTKELGFGENPIFPSVGNIGFKLKKSSK